MSHVKYALVLFVIFVALSVCAFFVVPIIQHYKPALPVVETAVPEVKQTDGSIIVERAPDARAKPRHEVPKGAKVERVASVTVLGGGLKMPGGEIKHCPPVTVELSLIREMDGGKRVIASSPDGQIIKAIDIPIETATPIEEAKKWAAGMSWSPTLKTSGVWIERDVMRARVGIDLNQTRWQDFGPTGTEARIRVGWNF